MSKRNPQHLLKFAAFALICCLAGGIGWESAAFCDEPLHWETDLKKAAAESKRTDKPMLIEITADWCHFCKKMKQSYEQPEVAKHVTSCFVPVEVDADENPRLVQAVGVEGLPTTVIVSPDLKVLKKITGYHPPKELNKQLETICQVSYEQPAAAPPVTQAAPQTQPAKAPPMPEPQPAAQPQPSVPAATTPAVSEQPVVQPVGNDQPHASFSGYCLVTLIDGRKYVEGDAQFTSTYRTQVLYFASAEEKKTFDAAPESYWPMIDGYCAVSYMERGDVVKGDPEWAAVFRGRVWFFADEASRNRFAETPAEYVPDNAR